MGIDPTLHLRVAPKTYISLGVSLIAGQASTFTNEQGTKIKLEDTAESFNRIDLQLGIRLNL